MNTTLKELMANVDQKKLVVFITAEESGWKYHENGIDGLTSASLKDKEPEVAKEIIARIDGILNRT